ncbi:MAG: phosphoheptose isomerase family protein, partial [Thermoplasmataceae archaeon]
CISTSGNSHERMRDLVRTLHALDSNVIEIDNRINDADSRDENLVKVPVLEEELSSVVNLIALQLLSFSVAVTRGMNPDNFRSDNPDFSKMDELLKL